MICVLNVRVDCLAAVLRGSVKDSLTVYAGSPTGVEPLRPYGCPLLHEILLVVAQSISLL